MNLKELLDIARILDGIELQKYYDKGGFNTPAFFNTINPFKKKEIISKYGQNEFIKLIDQYGYELTTITPKEIETIEEPEIIAPSSIYQTITNYYHRFCKLGYDPNTHTLKDAKEILRINNIDMIYQTIANTKASLKPTERKKLSYEIKKAKLEETNFKDIKLLNEILEDYSGR